MATTGDLVVVAGHGEPWQPGAGGSGGVTLEPKAPLFCGAVAAHTDAEQVCDGHVAALPLASPVSGCCVAAGVAKGTAASASHGSLYTPICSGSPVD